MAGLGGVLIFCWVSHTSGWRPIQEFRHDMEADLMHSRDRYTRVGGGRFSCLAVSCIFIMVDIPQLEGIRGVISELQHIRG